MCFSCRPVTEGQASFSLKENAKRWQICWALTCVSFSITQQLGVYLCADAINALATPKSSD